MKFNIAQHDQAMKCVDFVPDFHRAFFLGEMTHSMESMAIFSSMVNQLSLLGFITGFRLELFMIGSHYVYNLNLRAIYLTGAYSF